MKIKIVTDGSNTLGMGHVYQSMTLASLLRSHNKEIKVSFITKSDKNIINLLEKSGFDVKFCNDDQEIFETFRKEKPDRIIFDKLDVSPELAKNIKEELQVKLIIMTNITEANKYATVTVMAGMGSEFKNIYNKDDSNGQVQFWGPKYWLLRPEFFQYKRQTETYQKSIKNIMLIFGGADKANLTTITLDKLLEINRYYNVTIAIGAAFENQMELDEVINKKHSPKGKIEVYKGLTNVAEIMYNQDVIFVSPGLSFFEALLIGIPVLCIPQNEWQNDAWKGFIPMVKIDELDQLPSIMENNLFIFPNDKFISEMEIGQGQNEIIYEILR